jgi:hypothetical protein
MNKTTVWMAAGLMYFIIAVLTSGAEGTKTKSGKKLVAAQSMALFSHTDDGARRYIVVEETPAEETPVRVVQSFDSDWKFFKGKAKGANQINFNDSNWQRIQLPHDWSIEGPFDQNKGSGKRGGYLPLGVGWYRKQFDLSPGMRDKKVFVQFDGIYKNSDVWINGKHLGQPGTDM